MNNQQLTDRYWFILDSGGIPITPLNGWYLPEYIQRANGRGLGNADYWLRT